MKSSEMITRVIRSFLLLLLIGLSPSLLGQMNTTPQKYVYNICSGDTTMLVLPTVENVFYVWPEIPPLLEINGDSVRAFAVNNTEDAIVYESFIVRYYLVDFSTVTDTFILRVLPPIQENLPFLNYNICQGDTAVLYYPFIPYGYMTMDPDTFSLLDTLNGAPRIYMFPPSSNTYNLYIKNIANCRIGPYEVDVEVQTLYDSLVISSFDTVCIDSEPFTIDYYPEFGVLSGTGLIGDSTFSPLLAGDGNHVISMQVGTNGCLSFTDKTITVLSNDDVSFFPIPNLCQNDDKIELPETSPTGGLFDGVVFVEDSLIDPSTMNVGPHILTYAFFGDDGCTVKKEQQFFIKSFPDKPIISYNGDTIACETDTLNLVSSPSTNGYFWSTGATSQSIVAFTPNLYSVRVFSSNGCSNISDPLNLSFNPEPEFILSSPEYPNGYNVSAYSANDGQIDIEIVSAIGTLSFNWSNGSNLPSLSNLQAGEYWVLVSDQGGCTVADTIVLTQPDTVIVPEPPIQPSDTTLLIPNAFTPNGDGFNDLYVIRGLIPDHVENEFFVFDFRRQLVYSAKNYNNNWNGLDNNGKRLLTGTYYGVFKSKGLEKPYTTVIDLRYE